MRRRKAVTSDRPQHRRVMRPRGRSGGRVSDVLTVREAADFKFYIIMEAL